MSVTIGALRESAPQETRVSLVPEVADKLVKEGARVLVQRGAGERARFPDALYTSATWADSAEQVLAESDVVLTRAATHARADPAPQAQRGGHRLHAAARAARRGRGAQGARHHELRHGTGAAHLARAVDGRPVLAGGHRRLQGGAAGRQPPAEVLPHAHHRRRHHPPGAGADHRRRGRGTAGHRHRASPRRGGRGLRRAQRHQGAGEVPRRQVRRDRRERRRPRAATRAS